MEEVSKLKTFVVGILHQHDSELGTTIGKLEAADVNDAMNRSELWIARKKKEFNCGIYGNVCEAHALEAFRGFKSTVLTIGAEEIFPASKEQEEV